MLSLDAKVVIGNLFGSPYFKDEVSRGVVEKCSVFIANYEDFSIVDVFGMDAIKDTYDRAFGKWKSNYKYLTELVLILNWKIAEHYESNNTYTQSFVAIQITHSQ